MSDFPVLFTRGPSTYVDSLDATTDHSGLPFVPMRKDQTVMVLRLGMGEPPDEDAAAGSWILSLTAYEDFDGSPVVAVVPSDDSWVPSVSYADRPLAWSATTPLTYSGPIVAGQTITWDVSTFASTFAGGREFTSWLVYVTHVGTTGGFYGPQIRDDRGPSVLGDFTVAPGPPTGLVPASGQVVGEARPTLSIDKRDLTAIQVQVHSTAAGWVAATGWPSPTFNSGTVATTDPELDLNPTAITSLAESTDYYWTARTQDSTGWSDYADPVGPFTYAAKAVITITSPAFGVTGDPNPPYAWTTDGVQTQYQVLTYPQGVRATTLDDSEQVASAVGAYQPNPEATPKGTGAEGGVVLRDGSTVTGEIRVWDDVENRVATPGCPVYSTATTDYAFAINATVPPADSLRLRQVGLSPWVDFEFQTSSTFEKVIFSWGPDSDSTTHIARIRIDNLDDPVDVEGGLLYTWRWWGAQPWQPGYVGSVKLVVGDQSSDAEFGTLDSLEVSGFWGGDGDPASPTYNVIGQHSGVGTTVSRQDQVGVLTAYGAQFPMTQWVSEGFIVLNAQGVIRDFDDVRASVWEKSWRRLNSTGRPIQIAYDNVSFPALSQNWATFELDGTGDPFVKQVAHLVTQLDFASYADEPPSFGSPTITTYDFEEGVDGDPIVKESLGGSPGVIDKDGAPIYSEDAAEHGVLGADLGWRV